MHLTSSNCAINFSNYDKEIALFEQISMQTRRDDKQTN